MLTNFQSGRGRYIYRTQKTCQLCLETWRRLGCSEIRFSDDLHALLGLSFSPSSPAGTCCCSPQLWGSEGCKHSSLFRLFLQEFGKNSLWWCLRCCMDQKALKGFSWYSDWTAISASSVGLNPFEFLQLLVTHFSFSTLEHLDLTLVHVNLKYWQS